MPGEGKFRKNSNALVKACIHFFAWTHHWTEAIIVRHNDDLTRYLQHLYGFLSGGLNEEKLTWPSNVHAAIDRTPILPF